MKTFFTTLKPLCLLALLCFGTALGADTIHLQDGRILKNVRVTIGRDRITIDTEQGRQLSIEIRELKFIKKSPVHWSRKPTSRNGGEKKVIRRNPVTKKQPVIEEPHLEWVILESLVPGWSGFYRQHRYIRGAIFSIAELYALYELVRYLQPPRYLRDQNIYRLTTYTLLDHLMRDPDQANQEAFIGWLQLDTVTRPVLVPGNSRRAISFDHFSQRREGRGLALTAILSLDAILSAWQAYNQKGDDLQTRAEAPVQTFFRINPETGAELGLTLRY